MYPPAPLGATRLRGVLFQHVICNPACHQLLIWYPAVLQSCWKQGLVVQMIIGVGPGKHYVTTSRPYCLCPGLPEDSPEEPSNFRKTVPSRNCPKATNKHNKLTLESLDFQLLRKVGSCNHSQAKCLIFVPKINKSPSLDPKMSFSALPGAPGSPHGPRVSKWRHQACQMKSFGHQK